eukprot:TRINITY_DN12685_c0_g1_i1.p1 TRINITY_DN12685_c0_g1~~TRINITY_DN12685_c0_g1_i1.p1  ORF type:complete len:215 (-),score=24.75 TRINITY_DN12685_c0_g1_i1:115-759(-)
MCIRDRFYYYTNELKFSASFLGILQLMVSLSGVLGNFVYYKYLSKYSFKSVFTWTIVFGFVVSLSQLLMIYRVNRSMGIPDEAFSFGDNVAAALLLEINSMPMLVVACQLCPKRLEGTMYALLMSLLNISGTISMQFGAVITSLLGITEDNFDQIGTLILITSFASLLPIALLPQMKLENAVLKTKQEDEKIFSPTSPDRDIEIVNLTPQNLNV